VNDSTHDNRRDVAAAVLLGGDEELDFDGVDLLVGDLDNDNCFCFGDDGCCCLCGEEDVVVAVLLVGVFDDDLEEDEEAIVGGESHLKRLGSSSWVMTDGTLRHPTNKASSGFLNSVFAV